MNPVFTQVQANGLSIGCAIRGRGAPLVLVHGGEADHSMFDRLAAELAGDFTVIAYDQRDSGRTLDLAPQPRPYGLADMADDLALLIPALGYQRAHVFGHSLGGHIAQVFAARHPGRLDRLMLSSTWPAGCGLQTANPPVARQLAVWRGDVGKHAGDIAGLFFTPPYLADNPERIDMFRTSRRTPEQNGRRAALLGAPYPIQDRQIEAATLLLTGDADALIPAQASLAIARCLRDPGPQVHARRAPCLADSFPFRRRSEHPVVPADRPEPGDFLMNQTKRVFTLSMAGLAAGASSRAFAADPADSWPSRPVTFILPFPPGSGSDFLRMLADRLMASLGKPFLIDNRPGATGVIGTQLVAKAKPDGHTFLIGSNSSHVIAPLLLEKRPYDPIADFEPISMVLRYPLLLVVSPSLPIRTVGDLVDFARKNPGKLNYASIGQGSGTHLAAEWFKNLAGVDIVHVPYKGVSQAQGAVMSGEVQMWFDGPRSALQLVRTGRLQALAVTGPDRVIALPEVPTMQEAGIAGMDPRIWIGLFAPKGTPGPILEKLGTQVRRIVQMPDVKAFFEAEGTAEVVGGPPRQLADYVQKESKEWKGLIDRLGIKLE